MNSSEASLTESNGRRIAPAREASLTSTVPLARLFPVADRSSTRRYTVAVVLGLAAAGLVLPVNLWISSIVISLPLFIVLVSGWYGGFGPAMVTTLICAGGLGSLAAFDAASLGRAEIVRLIIFLPVAMLSGALSDTARRALLVSRQLSSTQARLRQEAETREAYYRALFDSSSDAILVADAAGRYIDANRAAGLLLGYEAGDLVGRSVSDLVEAAPGWADEEYGTFLDMGSWRGEVELRRRSGATVPVEAAATTIALEHGPIGISALRDVSERRRFEELRQHFLASVSHELRNVLTPILGNAQLLARLQRFDAASVQEVLDQSQRLARIVADLTDTASADAGRFELTRSEVELVDLVRGVVEGFQGRSDHHAITLHGDEAPIYGDWDRGRLQQVFENLLSNAVKYSPTGGDVSVTIRRLPEEVQVSVQDRGIGLSPDEIPQLFEPFTRATEARGSGIPGFGLGLHVVKLIVDAHGGEIHASSAGAMQGTRFDVRLPYK